MKNKLLPPSIPKKDVSKAEGFHLQGLEVQAIKLDKINSQQKNIAHTSKMMIANIQNYNQNLKKSSSNIQESRNSEQVQELVIHSHSKTPQERDNKPVIKYSKMPTNFELYSQDTSPSLQAQLNQQQYNININQVPQIVKSNSHKPFAISGQAANNSISNSKKQIQSSANSTSRSQNKLFINNQQVSLKNLNGNMKKPSSSQNSQSHMHIQQHQLQISFDQNEAIQCNQHAELNLQGDENDQLSGFVIGGQKLICTKQIPASAKESQAKNKKINNAANQPHLTQLANGKDLQSKLDQLNMQITNISSSNKHILPKLNANELAMQLNTNYIINSNNTNSLGNQQKFIKQSNSYTQIDIIRQGIEQQQQSLNTMQKQYLIPNSLNGMNINKSMNKLQSGISSSLNSTQRNQLPSNEEFNNLNKKQMHLSPKTNNCSFQEKSEIQEEQTPSESDSIRQNQKQNYKIKIFQKNSNPQHNLLQDSNQRQSQSLTNHHQFDKVKKYSDDHTHFSNSKSPINNEAQKIKQESFKLVSGDILQKDEVIQQKEEINPQYQRKRKESDSKCIMTTSGSSTATKQQNNESLNQGNPQQNHEFKQYHTIQQEPLQQYHKKPLFFEQKQNDQQQKILSPTLTSQNHNPLLNKLNSGQNKVNQLSQNQKDQKKSTKILKNPVVEQKEIKQKVKQEPLTIQQFELNEEFFRESFDGYNFDAEESLSGTWTGYTIQQYMKNQKEEKEQSRKGSAQKQKKKKNSLLVAKPSEENQNNAQRQGTPSHEPQGRKNDPNQKTTKTKEQSPQNQEIEEDIQVQDN